MSIREILETKAEKNGEMPFVSYNNQCVSFRDFNTNINKAVNVFQLLNIKKGDKVCLLLPDCLEYLYLWFALAKIGAVMVPLPMNIEQHKFRYILEQSAVKLIIINEKSASRNLKIKNKLFLLHGDTDDPPDGFILLKNLTSSSSDKVNIKTNINGNDPLAIFYSFAKQGAPIGSVVSHSNYINTGRMWIEDIIEYKKDDILHSSLSLNHPCTQILTVMGSLLSGCPFIMREKSFIRDFWEVILEHSITIFFYTPQIIYALLNQTEESNIPDTNLRIVYGPRISKELWIMFEKRFGIKLLSGYWHDASGLCLSNNKFHTKLGSIGVPTKYYDVGIWGENNKELPIGQIGEMVVKTKGPEYEFSGYYRLKDKNRESWQNGWFKTGDAAYRDVEGYFYYIDKIEKCVLVNGTSISAAEIENEVNAYPNVLTSTVEIIQSESDLSSYIINVKIIPKKDKQLDTHSLIESCGEKLGLSIDHMEIEIVGDFSHSLTNRLKLTV